MERQNFLGKFLATVQAYFYQKPTASRVPVQGRNNQFLSKRIARCPQSIMDSTWRLERRRFRHPFPHTCVLELSSETAAGALVFGYSHGYEQARSSDHVHLPDIDEPLRNQAFEQRLRKT